MYYKKDEIWYRKTKNDVPRKVKVHPELMKDLYEYLVNKKGILGGQYCFFTDGKNVKSRYDTLRYYLDRLVKKGILDEEVVKNLKKTHTFRHISINIIYEETGDILATGAYHGQKRPDSTMRYIHKLQRKKAIERGSDAKIKALRRKE